MSRVGAVAATALAALALAAPAEAKCKAAFLQGFTPYTKARQYSVEDVARDFPTTKGPFKMVDGGDQGSPSTKVDGQAIQAFFPEGKITGKESGFTWYSMLPEESMEYSMQYKVKFMDGFDWTRGGKLPGLCGGDGGGRGSFCPVGCSKVSKDRGFSMRLMWRQDGAIATYAYYPDKPDSVHCGEDWLWSKKLRAGKWHTIRMYAKLNTVTGDDAKEDGVFKAYLDGKLVLEKTGIRYRYDEKFLISRAYITTYVGGSSRKLFAPQQDQHVWFDEMAVWEGDCAEPEDGGVDFESGEVLLESAAQPDEVESPGADGAPAEAGGYSLHNGEAGWDVPGKGAIKRLEPKRGSQAEEVAECAKYCDRNAACSMFTYYGSSCYLKRDTGATPVLTGEDELGWRKLYVKSA